MRDIGCTGEANRKMDVVGDASGAVAFAASVSGHRGEVGVEGGAYCGFQVGNAVFCTEDKMNEKEGERLWHGEDYRSGLQPSGCGRSGTWGFAPGWYRTRLRRFASMGVF